MRRITVLAWEEMDQPLKDINHKVVVRLVRVLIAARREKHQETRVSVERRKAENWLAREVLREWRRTRKKQAHVSYLPIWGEGRVVGETPTTATGTVAVPENRRVMQLQQAPALVLTRTAGSGVPALPAVANIAVEREKGAFRAENRRKSELTPMLGID